MCTNSVRLLYFSLVVHLRGETRHGVKIGAIGLIDFDLFIQSEETASDRVPEPREPVYATRVER